MDALPISSIVPQPGNRAVAQCNHDVAVASDSPPTLPYGTSPPQLALRVEKGDMGDEIMQRGRTCRPSQPTSDRCTDRDGCVACMREWCLRTAGHSHHALQCATSGTGTCASCCQLGGGCVRRSTPDRGPTRGHACDGRMPSPQCMRRTTALRRGWGVAGLGMWDCATIRERRSPTRIVRPSAFTRTPPIGPPITNISVLASPVQVRYSNHNHPCQRRNRHVNAPLCTAHT